MIGHKAAAIGGGLLAALVVAPIAYIVGDLKGGWEAAATAQKAAELAEAQGQRDAAHADLRAAHEAAEAMRRITDEARAEAAKAEERLGDYEAELARRGDAARCTLDDDDARRMREGSPAGPALPRPSGR